MLELSKRQITAKYEEARTGKGLSHCVQQGGLRISAGAMRKNEAIPRCRLRPMKKTADWWIARGVRETLDVIHAVII